MPMPRLVAALITLASTQMAAAQGPEAIQPLDQRTLDPRIGQRIDRITSHLLPPMVKESDLQGGKTLDTAMRDAHATAVSIAVIHNGRIEWARGFGTLSGGNQKVTEETLFQAASLSKPVSAMAALYLVQHKQLSLDADINDALTSWRLPASALRGNKTVSLRQLLNHTAGLTARGFPGYAAGDQVPSVPEILDGLPPAVNPPVRIRVEPGSSWGYSGGGYVILQQLVTDTTHETFPAFLEAHVLRPIGMTHSGYYQPLPARLTPNAALPFRENGAAVEGGPHTYPELAPAGLWSTPTDLAKFLIELQLSFHGQANRVLDEPMTRQMLSPGQNNWGLGISLGGPPDHRFFGHGGANAGYESLMTAFLDTGDGAVIMTNVDGGQELAETLLRSIALEYQWPAWAPRVVKTITVDQPTLNRYIGTYAVDPTFEFVVSLRDGKLIARGTGQSELELLPESPTRFAMVSDVDLEFIVDSTGIVTGLNVLQNGEKRLASKK